VVVSSLVTPLHGPGDTSLPVLYSTFSEDGEGGCSSPDEAHTLGLNNGIDNDGVPGGDGSGSSRGEEKRKYEPSAVLRGGLGMV